MTDIDKARVALFDAATDYAYAINHDSGYERTMESADNLECAARRFAKQWEKEMREYRKAGDAAKRTAPGPE